MKMFFFYSSVVKIKEKKSLFGKKNTYIHVMHFDLITDDIKSFFN